MTNITTIIIIIIIIIRISSIMEWRVGYGNQFWVILSKDVDVFYTYLSQIHQD